MERKRVTLIATRSVLTQRNELKHIQLAFEHRKGMLFIIPLENYLITCWKIHYIV